MLYFPAPSPEQEERNLALLDIVPPPTAPMRPLPIPDELGELLESAAIADPRAA